MQYIGIEPGALYPLYGSSGSNVLDTSWDVETIVNAGTLYWGNEQVGEVRYGFTASTDHNLTLNAGNTYYLSDGSYYDGQTDVVHTWDVEKNTFSDSATGAVIVCNANKNIAFQCRRYDYDGMYVLNVYFGDCNLTSLILNGNYQGGTYANTSTKNIKCSDKTTANSDLLAHYVISGTPIGGYHFAYTNLTYLDIPEGVTSVGGSSSFNNFTGNNATVKLPKSMISIGSNLNVSGITNIIVPEGFNSSLQSTYLTVVSMNNIIRNYADRTGLDTLTFTVGATKLALLSDEIKTLAADKNITLV